STVAITRHQSERVAYPSTCSNACNGTARSSNGSARARNSTTAVSSNSPYIIARNGSVPRALPPRMAGILGDHRTIRGARVRLAYASTRHPGGRRERHIFTYITMGALPLLCRRVSIPYETDPHGAE